MVLKHTPGPYDRIDGTVFALDKTGTVNRFSCSMQGGWVERAQGWNNGDATPTAELIANATLFTAAPDLLAAAMVVVARWDAPNWQNMQPTAEAIDGLRHAIARATGAA